MMLDLLENMREKSWLNISAHSVIKPQAVNSIQRTTRENSDENSLRYADCYTVDTKQKRKIQLDRLKNF